MFLHFSACVHYSLLYLSYDPRLSFFLNTQFDVNIHIDPFVNAVGRFLRSNARVWGGILFDHRSKLVIESEHCKGQVIAVESLSMSVVWRCSNEDNADCHTAHVCQNFIQKHTLPSSQWLSLFRDLERVLDCLGHCVWSWTLQLLRCILLPEWNAIHKEG